MIEMQARHRKLVLFTIFSLLSHFKLSHLSRFNWLEVEFGFTDWEKTAD